MADAPDPLGRRSLFWATAGAEAQDIGRETRPLGKHAFYSKAPPGSRRNIAHYRGSDSLAEPDPPKRDGGLRGAATWERLGLGSSGVLGPVVVDCSSCTTRTEVGVGQIRCSSPPDLVVAPWTRVCETYDVSVVRTPGLVERIVAALGALTIPRSVFGVKVLWLVAYHLKVAALGVVVAAAAKSPSSSGGIQGWLLHLHGPIVYVAVGGLLFLEVGIVVGFFIPGEVATILGGVIASQHHANLPTMIVVVALCASIGNLSGYGVGVLIGPWLLDRKYLKNNAGVIRTRDLIARRGGSAVFVGRWVVFVRAVLPGVAGVSRMHLRNSFSSACSAESSGDPCGS